MVDNLTKPGPGKKYPVEVNGKTYLPGNRWWGVTEEGMKKLIGLGRIQELKSTIGYRRYFYDFPYSYETNFWRDTSGAGSAQKLYVVQTNPLMIQKCILMTTDPGDVVLDITCGSGTTVDYVQVSYSNDDSFEWFGGSVDCKHLVALAGLDDDFPNIPRISFQIELLALVFGAMLLISQYL